MFPFGNSWMFVLFQLFNIVLLLGWPLLSLLALFGLRGRSLADTTQVLWALLIVAVPYLGALAFWIVQPGQGRPPVSPAAH